MVTGQKPAADAPSGAGAPRLHGDNALPQHAFDSLGDGLLSRILSFLDHEGRKAPRAAHPRIRAAADALVREVAACGFSQIARDNVTHLFRNAARWPRVEALQCRFVEPPARLGRGAGSSLGGLFGKNGYGPFGSRPPPEVPTWRGEEEEDKERGPLVLVLRMLRSGAWCGARRARRSVAGTAEEPTARSTSASET